MAALDATDPAPAVDRGLDEQIGANVHQLMWQRRITQTALAPRMGIAQTVLSKKLRGAVTWTARDLANVATVFGVTMDELVWPQSGRPSPVAIVPESSAPRAVGGEQTTD